MFASATGTPGIKVVAFTAVPDAQWTVVGSDIGADAGLVGAGLLLEISGQFEAVADYGGQFSGSGSSHAGSIGLHTALGFDRVGVVRSCGWKFGRWLDIVLMEKTLGWGDRTPPTEG